MAGELHRLRDKPGETEKITINLGFVDLGHIDLLVHEGFYSNAPTSSGRRSAASSPLMRITSSDRSCGTLSNSAYDAIAAKIWRR
jgi:hypothetical protein